MEYNTFQYQDQTNLEGLHAQECTNMNDILYHLCPDLGKKKTTTTSTSRPSQIWSQKGKQTFCFFRPCLQVQWKFTVIYYPLLLLW